MKKYLEEKKNLFKKFEQEWLNEDMDSTNIEMPDEETALRIMNEKIIPHLVENIPSEISKYLRNAVDVNFISDMHEERPYLSVYFKLDIPDYLTLLFKDLFIKIEAIKASTEYITGFISYQYDHIGGGSNGKTFGRYTLYSDGRFKYYSLVN